MLSNFIELNRVNKSNFKFFNSTNQLNVKTLIFLGLRIINYITIVVTSYDGFEFSIDLRSWRIIFNERLSNDFKTRTFRTNMNGGHYKHCCRGIEGRYSLLW